MITSNNSNAKYEVVITQICYVLLFRSSVEDPPGPAHRPASARARLHDRMCTSVSVPTPMAAAHGPYPTIPVVSWSRVGATPVKRSHFPAKPMSRPGPPTEPRDSHTRSLFQTTVGHRSLGHAHRPYGVGALAGSALSRPRWAAILARVANLGRSCAF